MRSPPRRPSPAPGTSTHAKRSRRDFERSRRRRVARRCCLHGRRLVTSRMPPPACCGGMLGRPRASGRAARAARLLHGTAPWPVPFAPGTPCPYHSVLPSPPTHPQPPATGEWLGSGQARIPRWWSPRRRDQPHGRHAGHRGKGTSPALSPACGTRCSRTNAQTQPGVWPAPVTRHHHGVRLRRTWEGRPAGS